MNFKALQEKFNDMEYFKRNFFSEEANRQADGSSPKKLDSKNYIDFTSVVLKKIDWFPEGLAYEMNISKEIIKKNPGLKRIQRFITHCSDAGFLTRQELVSMLPPLFLDIKESDMVLDMCAAPGSKTSQMIEAQLAQAEGKPTIFLNGGVVANDADSKRAYMLTHQLQRIDASGMLVVNHEGQFLPSFKKEKSDGHNEKFHFDKVLADVPCSGDGAIRKLPQKWRGWSSRDCCGLHPLQISILERAIQLTKVDGLVVYSTCSLNPIENEAVVSDVLSRANKESPGSLELVDIHGRYPGLISRKGIDHWSMLLEKSEMKQFKTGDSKAYKAEDLFDIVNTYEEGLGLKSNHNLKGIVYFYLASMFAPDSKVLRDEQKIQYTMRIMPEDQDTGGFYVALFKKNAHIAFRKAEEPQAEGDEQKSMQKTKLNDGTSHSGSIDDQTMIAPDKNAPIKIEKEKKGGYRVPKVDYLPFTEKYMKEWEAIRDLYGFEDVCFLLTLEYQRELVCEYRRIQ